MFKSIEKNMKVKRNYFVVSMFFIISFLFSFPGEDTLRKQQLQEDDSSKRSPSGRRRITWQYYDAMDMLYSEAKQKFIEEKRKSEASVGTIECRRGCARNPAQKIEFNPFISQLTTSSSILPIFSRSGR